MTGPEVIVVGAGIGGLAAAVDLARRGCAVTVLEAAEQPGGKMREVEISGRRIDSGPTVFTMPWVFEELFADAGSDAFSRLDLEPAEVLARHAWPDGSRLDLFSDADRSADAIAAFAGRAEADRYRAFSARARRTFETLYQPYMRAQRPKPWSLIAANGLAGLIDLWRIRPFRSLWRELGEHFRDPRLRGLFARYATYCGGSPLHSPATLMLVAHVEQLGVWRIGGGMQRLAEALVAALTERAGRVRYGCRVAGIEVEGSRAAGVRLESGEKLKADAVIANADVAALRRGRLGPAAAAAVPRFKQRRSLSAVTWSMVAEVDGFEPAHHNVFFPDDYPREFEDIFERASLPRRPAVYACVQDSPRDASDRTDRGERRLFLITNAPPLGDREAFGADRIARQQDAAFGLLEACGMTLRFAADRVVVRTPADYEHRFPGTGGALYGAAPHGWRASFTRPGARSRLPGLFLAGGSVHPGAGVPMTAISGRLAADAAAADLGLR